MPAFISYSSVDRELFHLRLGEVLEYCKVQFWIDEKIENGENIPETLREMIYKCEVCILFATENSLKSEWCKMEIGAFWGAGKRVMLFSPNGNLTQEELPPYLRMINFNGSAIQIAQEAQKEIDKFVIDGPNELINAAQELTEKLEPSQLCDVPALKESSAMLAVVCKYLETTGNNIDQIKAPISHLSVPATEYPDYLIDIQRLPQARVKAIALVDEIERFWNNEIGDNILHVSERNKTQRVFVFKKQKDFQNLKRAVKDHCRKYDVRLISAQNLPLSREEIHDFSLIWSSDENIENINVSVPPLGTILAHYKTKHGTTEIEFSSDTAIVERYWRWFNDIYYHENAVSEDKNSNMDRAAKRIFEIGQQEMSYYIPEVLKYDKCERLHPYFQDMRTKMLEVLTNWKQCEPKILEFGAGTGILSREILENLKANNSQGKLLCVEYDSRYFEYLCDQLKAYSNFFPIQKNAKSHDPEGKFDIIFSSFADHHIVRNDDTAALYYDNIRKNLFPGSVFVVGDEFLRDHNPTNAEERIKAIEAYHNHIIEQAQIEMGRAQGERRKDYEGMIQLETAAMESGIMAVTDSTSNNAGDYKVSIAHFRRRIEQAGLEIADIEVIGPKDESIRTGCGGIYTIKIRLPLIEQ